MLNCTSNDTGFYLNWHQPPLRKVTFMAFPPRITGPAFSLNAYPNTLAMRRPVPPGCIASSPTDAGYAECPFLITLVVRKVGGTSEMISGKAEAINSL